MILILISLVQSIHLDVSNAQFCKFHTLVAASFLQHSITGLRIIPLALNLFTVFASPCLKELVSLRMCFDCGGVFQQLGTRLV